MLTLQNKPSRQTAFGHDRKLNARSHLQDVLTLEIQGKHFHKGPNSAKYSSSAELEPKG